MYSIIYPGELCHHGIKGQKWGVRRFQNEDGSVTPAGAERYYVGKKVKEAGYSLHRPRKTMRDSKTNEERKRLSKGAKTAIAVGTVAAATTVAVLATRKYNKEKALAENVLRVFGADIMKSQKELSDRIHDLETAERYKDKSYAEMTRKAKAAYAADKKRVGKAYSTASNQSKLVSYIGEQRSAVLGANAYYGRGVSGTALASNIAGAALDRGKRAVQRILAVAA